MGIGKKIVKALTEDNRPPCGVFNPHKGNKCKSKKRAGYATCGAVICESYNAVNNGWV